VVQSVDRDGKPVTMRVSEPFPASQPNHPCMREWAREKAEAEARERAQMEELRKPNFKRMFPGQRTLPVVSLAAEGGFVVGGVENSKKLIQGMHPYAVGATLRAHPLLGRSLGLMAAYRTTGTDGVEGADGSMIPLPNLHSVRAGASGRVNLMDFAQVGLDLYYEYLRGKTSDDAGVRMPLEAHSFGFEISAQVMIKRRFGVGFYVTTSAGPKVTGMETGLMLSAGL
jgi:hypothetical protein